MGKSSVQIQGRDFEIESVKAKLGYSGVSPIVLNFSESPVTVAVLVSYSVMSLTFTLPKNASLRGVFVSGLYTNAAGTLSRCFDRINVVLAQSTFSPFYVAPVQALGSAANSTSLRLDSSQGFVERSFASGSMRFSANASISLQIGASYAGAGIGDFLFGNAVLEFDLM